MGTDPSIKAEIIEEFQKETFWQRMGLKKVDKEGPLYGLAGKKMDIYRTDLKKILEKAFDGKKEIFKRKLEILERH